MKPITLCAIIAPIIVVSCDPYPKDTLPTRSGMPVKNSEMIQKSVVHGGSTVFLQSRKKGILTNDLMMESPDGSVRYLSDNRFYIKDFCITKGGMLYYIEAGEDYGYMVGTRGRDFRIRNINLNDWQYRIEPFLADRIFVEPSQLELSNDQRLLCFATRFGDIHVIDLDTRREINIIPQDMDPKKVLGHKLTPDKKAFRVQVHTGVDNSGKFLWETRTLPLPSG